MEQLHTLFVCKSPPKALPSNQRGTRKQQHLWLIKIWLGILMENSWALDFTENIQSGRIFDADSLDTVIIGLP